MMRAASLVSIAVAALGPASRTGASHRAPPSVRSGHETVVRFVGPNRVPGIAVDLPSPCTPTHRLVVGHGGKFASINDHGGGLHGEGPTAQQPRGEEAEEIETRADRTGLE